MEILVSTVSFHSVKYNNILKIILFRTQPEPDNLLQNLRFPASTKAGQETKDSTSSHLPGSF